MIHPALRRSLATLVATAALAAVAVSPALAQPGGAAPGDRPGATGAGDAADPDLTADLGGPGPTDSLPEQVPATIPSGWVMDPNHGDAVRRGVVTTMPAEVKRSGVRVWSYHPPQRGAQLMVTVARMDVGAADPGVVVRKRIADLRSSFDVMVDEGDRVHQVSWSERTDEAARVVEADLEWVHDGDQLLSMTRARWVRIDGLLEERRVECVMASDQASTLRPVCAQVLASLQLAPAADRQPIAVAAVAAGASDALDDATGGEAVPGGPVVGAAPSMRETPDGVATPVVVRKPAAAAAPDRRPWYGAGGLLILLAALWWNRGRRRILEGEPRVGRYDHVDDEADDDRDGDADDLAAAARDVDDVAGEDAEDDAAIAAVAADAIAADDAARGDDDHDRGDDDDDRDGDDDDKGDDDEPAAETPDKDAP